MGGILCSASASFEIALEHYPNDKSTLNNSGSAQTHTNLWFGRMQRGDFQNGCFHLKKALELDTSKTLSNLNRAMAIEQQIRSNITALLKAVDKAPLNPRLLAHLANPVYINRQQ